MNICIFCLLGIKIASVGMGQAVAPVHVFCGILNMLSCISTLIDKIKGTNIIRF